MPFMSDNPQDVWGRIEALKVVFQPRETLLRQCDEILGVLPTEWNKARKKMVYEADNARLVGQQQAATVRVAVPFRLKLPTFPDQSGLDQRRLERTEHAASAFWEMAAQDAAQRGLRDPRYEMAASAVEQGAIAGMAWWQENHKGELRPRLELYAPRYVYYDTDKDGIVFLYVAFSLPEAQLAGLVEAQQWQGQYQRTDTQRLIYQVWMRDGGAIIESVVGAPEARGLPLALMPARERPEFTEVPVRYIPAGGPFSRLWTPRTGAGFEQVYGQPFIGPGIPIVDSMNFLGRMIFRAGLTAVEPAKVYTPGPGEPDVAPELELGYTTVVHGQFQDVPQVSAAAIPHLTQQHGVLGSLLEQVGLPGPLLTGSPTPRSELLRAGLEEMGLQALVPYWGCLGSAVRGFSEDWRRGQHYNFEHGVKTMTLEMEPTGVVTLHPQRENRAYEVDDFWWDGSFEVILKPPDAREMLVRNFQIYSLATSNPQSKLDPLYLAELLLGIEDAGLQYQRAVRRQLKEAQTPVMAALQFDRDLTQLETILRLVGNGTVEEALDKKASFLQRIRRQAPTKLTQEDVAWLTDLGDLVGMASRDVLAWGPHELEFLQQAMRVLAKDLRQRVIPQERRPELAEGQKQGAPATGAAVGPEQAPTQGSPAGMGFGGGGGPGDEMAALLRAQSGSDQTGGA